MKPLSFEREKEIAYVKPSNGSYRVVPMKTTVGFEVWSDGELVDASYMSPENARQLGIQLLKAARMFDLRSGS
jgi:hypothetical protein